MQQDLVVARQQVQKFRLGDPVVAAHQVTDDACHQRFTKAILHLVEVLCEEENLTWLIFRGRLSCRHGMRHFIFETSRESSFRDATWPFEGRMRGTLFAVHSALHDVTVCRGTGCLNAHKRSG